MTDKNQIIINGVNVSECFHYINNKEYTCRLNHTPFHYRHCEDCPNCYYKQLARKIQECEELKKANLCIDTNRQCKGSKLKQIEDLIFACESGYTDEFIQKIYDIIQESEPTINDYSIIGHYRKALEELKNKLNEYERAGGILDEGEAWYGLAKRYEQALEEIEHKIIHDYCVGCDYSCDVCEYKEILDIITKAKEGNYDKM